MFDPSDRFNRVECVLDDVLGTAGLRGDAFAREVEGETGTPFASVRDSTSLLLRSGVGAFGSLADESVRIADGVGRALIHRRAGGSDIGVRVAHTTRSPSGQHIVKVQTLRGKRVVGGSFGVHASAQGTAVSGAPIADLHERDPGPVPRRRKSTVTEAMRDHLDLDEATRFSLETVLFPLPGGGVWAYLGRGVVWTDEELADLRVIVRADNLSLLTSRDAAPAALWGEGRAHPQNPNRTPTTVPVRLEGFGSADESTLRSSFLDVAPRRGDRLVGPQRNWSLTETDAGFDEVSAYHHVSRAIRWFQEIIGPDLFSAPPFTPLKVVTGDRATRDFVARFLPSEATLIFGDGALSGTRCADICTHEVTHAVVWAAGQIDEIGPIEARGLNEGYADYAQASRLDDPRMGDWVAPTRARDCSRPDLRFPPDAAQTRDPYAIGAAWAAVLWELRGAIGPELADLLAVDTIFYLGEASTLQDARGALLTSDAHMFPSAGPTSAGRHADAIADAFDRRMT